MPHTDYMMKLEVWLVRLILKMTKHLSSKGKTFNEEKKTQKASKCCEQNMKHLSLNENLADVVFSRL